MVLYFLWDSDLFKKLRGIDTSASEKTVDSTFNIAPAPKIMDDSFPMKIGSRGDKVRLLQKSLNTINSKFPFNGKYSPLVTDGVLGKDTYEHVLILAGTAFWSKDGLTGDKWSQIITRATNLTTT